MAQNCDCTAFEVSNQVRILVTGGLGFVGGHLVEELLRQYPAAEIVVLDAKTYAANEALARKFENANRVRIIVGDVCDFQAVSNAMIGCSLVFHLAAESHVPRSFDDPDIFEKSNVLGTKTIAEACVNHCVERLVYVSTDEVYGQTLQTVDERAPFRPTTPYAASKANGELALVSSIQKGLDVCIARPTNALGPRQHLEKVAPKFVRQAIAGAPITIEGTGLQERCFLPVCDLANALILIAQKSSTNQSYNIAGKDFIEIGLLAERIKQMTSSSSPIERVEDRQINDAAYRICGQKIANLGFRQTSNLDLELKKIVSKTMPCRSRKTSVAPPTLIPSMSDTTGPVEKIEFHHPYRSLREAGYVRDVLLEGQSRYGGRFSQRATDLISQNCSGSDIELTNSCTAAMEVAALACGVGPGDEIIVPSFTFAATATAFARTGATIVLCDIDPDTMTVGLDNILAVASDRTKAVVPVHYGGNVASMESIVAWARESNIWVVEDAAQAVGSKLRGKQAGTFGDFGAFSFHETKILHCGHGGALVINTDSEEAIERARIALDRGTNFRDFANGNVDHYEWTGQGGSFRPTELQCAQLCGQLEALQEIVSKRKILLEHYQNRFGTRMLQFGEGVASNGSAAIVLADSSFQKEQLLADAKCAGINLSSHYKPLHLSKGAITHQSKRSRFEVANSLWDRVVRLPIHTDMNTRDVDHVVDFLAANSAALRPTSLHDVRTPTRQLLPKSA